MIGDHAGVMEVDARAAGVEQTPWLEGRANPFNWDMGLIDAERPAGLRRGGRFAPRWGSFAAPAFPGRLAGMNRVQRLGEFVVDAHVDLQSVQEIRLMGGEVCQQGGCVQR